MEAHVAVIGGGVAGAVAAVALARLGCSVVLLEAGDARPWRIGETLGPESRPVLQALGIWESFQQGGHLPSHGNASAWGGEGVTERDFVFNVYGHAWQLDRPAFETMLLAAAERAGAKVVRGTEVEQIHGQPMAWSIPLPGRELRCAWLLDATGRRATVGRRMGARRLALDSLVAIYTIVSAAADEEDTRTFIESVPDGWWYSAVVPGGRRTLSYQSDADQFSARECRDSLWFRRQFEQTKYLRSRAAFPEQVTPRLTSACSGRLDSFCGDGWLAIGDAAMSFDPLSGQGMVKAMETALQAAQVILGADSTASLKSFAAWNESKWHSFVDMRLSYYAMEQRWPKEPFWDRRHSDVISIR